MGVQLDSSNLEVVLKSDQRYKTGISSFNDKEYMFSVKKGSFEYIMETSVDISC